MGPEGIVEYGKFQKPVQHTLGMMVFCGLNADLISANMMKVFGVGRQQV